MINPFISDIEVLLNFIDSFAVEKDCHLILENEIFSAKCTVDNNGFLVIKFQPESFIHEDILFNKDILLDISGTKIKVPSTNIVSVQSRFHNGSISVLLNINGFNSEGQGDNNSSKNAISIIRDNSFSFHQIGVLDSCSCQYNNSGGLINNCFELEIEGSIMNFGLIKNQRGQGFLVLTSQLPISNRKFLDVFECIRIAIGLLSGRYFAENTWFFSLLNDVNHFSFSYENVQKSLNNCHPIIDCERYTNCPENEHKLTSNHFNNLVNLLYQNEEVKRASHILIQASAVNGISKGCLAAIALETIKSKIINKENANDSHFVDDCLQGVINELKSTLKKSKKQLGDKLYNKISDHISRINTHSNAEELKLPFEILGIVLTNEELHCIKCRNDFLHGGRVNYPKEEFYKNIDYTDLENIIANKLIMLTSMLVLKKCGYNGKVIDWGYTEFIKSRFVYTKQYKSKYGVCFRNIGGD